MTAAFSTSEALQYGFARFGEETGYCFGLFAAVEGVCLVSSAVLAFHVGLAAQLITGLHRIPPDTILYAFLPIYFLVRIASQVLLNKALLMLHDGRKITWDEILGFDFGYHMPSIMRVSAATIIYSIWSGMLTLFFILPGLFASSNLRFFKFVIVDRETEAIEGLRESYTISGTSKGELVSLNILSTVMRVVGFLCLGIGFIPVSAICGLAEAYAYKRLVQAYEFSQQHAAPEPM
jgi:phosphatidylglycerophosphatase A